VSCRLAKFNQEKIRDVSGLREVGIYAHGLIITPTA